MDAHKKSGVQLNKCIGLVAVVIRNRRTDFVSLNVFDRGVSIPSRCQRQVSRNCRDIVVNMLQPCTFATLRRKEYRSKHDRLHDRQIPPGYS